MLLCQEVLGFVSTANQFVKRHGRSGRVVATFGRALRNFRNGIQDPRVCGSWVFFLRGLWIVDFALRVAGMAGYLRDALSIACNRHHSIGLPEGMPVPNSVGWVS